MSIPDSSPRYTLTAYAARRGVSKMAVSDAVKKGRLTECVGRDQHGRPFITDMDLADREWTARTDHTTSPAYVKDREAARSPTAAKDMTVSEASAVEKYWKAKQAEMNFKKEAGELIPAKDMTRRLVDVFQTCRTRLLGIPSRARQALPHLTVADIAALEDLVRESLEALST